MLIMQKKIGNVPVIHSKDIPFSRVGIGFEKLDRAVFDPNKAYDRVAELGVKWVRIQSGWQRTETEKGIYHFEWLDEIVENLLKRGLEPWICLCYGNGLYDKQAAERFGGVGCPPTQTPEQVKAWHDYVVAVVKHFEGRVTWWELWNEPDCRYSWRYTYNMTEYTAFAHTTAEAVKEGSARAKIIGGAFAGSSVQTLTTCFREGLADFCDAISFHVYSADESYALERVANLKAMIRMYKPSLKLIQGEGGCQSRHDGRGALAHQAWTPEKQMKSLARYMITHLGEDVMFSSYFSCMDMIEALNGKVGDKASYLDYGYFGVLGADFDENGIASGEYIPKPSYRTLQTIAAVFRGDFKVEHLPVSSISRPDSRYGGEYMNPQLSECVVHTFTRAGGAAAIAYWKKTKLLRETYEGSISFMISQVPGVMPKLVDMTDGSIYELEEGQVLFNPTWEWESQQNIPTVPIAGNQNVILLQNIPLFDHPMMVTFGDFF